MVSFGKAEVYIGYSADLVRRIKSALMLADISCGVKEVDHAQRERRPSPRTHGEAACGARLFVVSVSQNDNAQARRIVGQILQQRIQGGVGVSADAGPQGG